MLFLHLYRSSGNHVLQIKVDNIKIMYFYRRSRNEDGAIASSGAQQLQHQHAMVPLQDSYMQSRTEALQNVESTIHELGSIFTQLATMVAQQGEIALR
jgi:syntaxin 5